MNYHRLRYYFKFAQQQLVSDNSFLETLHFVMLMARNFGSELWSPTGLLLIPQMIYEHGNPQQNDTDREKLKNVEQNLSQIPLGLTLASTQASAVRGRGLAARATAQPNACKAYILWHGFKVNIMCGRYA
jgi:hypothetical protein